MPSITTSYFAVNKKLEGTKISIARYNPPKIVGRVEIQTAFAPLTKLIRGYKNNLIDWQGYKKDYIKEQRIHFKEKPEDFRNLLKRATVEDIVLLCYEKYQGPETKCHRLLLYNMLKEISGEMGYSVNFVDEKKNIRKIKF